MNKVKKIAIGIAISSLVITGVLAFRITWPGQNAQKDQKVGQQKQGNYKLSKLLISATLSTKSKQKPFYSTKFALLVKPTNKPENNENTYGNKTVALAQPVVNNASKAPVVATSMIVKPAPAPLVQPVASRGSDGMNGFSQNDLDMLAHLVNAEGAAEPYEGQVAITAVVLNRLKSPIFPKKISGIIYEKWAFECVANGWFYHTPTAVSYQAARAAINGWDPTNGALYYWNPATAASPWVWQKKIIKTIGNHVFAL